MNRLLVGWVALWIGLLLTVVSGRHAAGYFVHSPELAAIQGGDPVPVPGLPPNGNGWCSSGCNCQTLCGLWINGQCCWCTNAANNGPTTSYLCCVNKSLGNKYGCVNGSTTGNCGAFACFKANPAGNCGDPTQGTSVCNPASGNEPACSSYQVVDPASSGCPPK